MCEVLDRIEEKGRMEGFEQGFEKAILTMLKNHMSIKTISTSLNVSEEYVKQLAHKYNVSCQD